MIEELTEEQVREWLAWKPTLSRTPETAALHRVCESWLRLKARDGAVEGWPTGYTPVTWTEGHSGLERHSWQRDNVVAREGWDTIEACLESAHAHYRTTREWRLEQERDKLLRGWELSRETTRSLERQLAEVTRERDAAQRAERELQQRIASMVPR